MEYRRNALLNSKIMGIIAGRVWASATRIVYVVLNHIVRHCDALVNEKSNAHMHREKFRILICLKTVA
jgi:hypothetical protein